MSDQLVTGRRVSTERGGAFGLPRHLVPATGAAAVVLFVVLGATTCRADWSDPTGPLLIPGLNLGAAGGQGPATVLLGGEISLAEGFDGFSWAGGYADVLWLPTRDRVRLSVGPEFGFLMLGVDGGPLIEIDEQGARPGIAVRPLLSLMFVHGYARFGRTFGEHESSFHELGLLLKYPIDLKEL